MRNRTHKLALLALTLLLLSGCAATKSYHVAERHMRREHYDEAVLSYSKALALDPGNTRYAVALERAKLRSAAEHFDKGKRYHNAEQLELAIAEYQQTLVLFPDHQHAMNELQKAARELQRRQAGPSSIETLKERARRRDLGPPRLDPRSNIPILLNFQEVEVGKIFEAMSKASGINFIYDEKVELDRPRTIDLGNVTLEKALDVLMLQTKNFYKVIDDHTLLIAPDTRQKRQEYEDQVIRTFFLSNADTKTVVTLLRSLLQSRQIAENADLNSVTLKDTPEKVAIGERILNANDKAKGEVLIDVELLEIDRTTARNVGLDLSSKTLSLTFQDGKQSLPLNNLNPLKQSGNWTLGVIPSVVINFLKSDSDTKIIAKPQVRVSEGERAEILIGNRVPIPTTSFNSSNTVGGSIVPITSFTYQNVGITVQIEPRVHHNKEVTLQIQVEVSQVTGTISTTGGQAQPIIGTRQIQTVIRLRDGETNLLAGLISKEDKHSRSGVVGISDIPGLGRVMGNTDSSLTETDIIMTLTPHIVRIPDITEEDLMTLWVGTEDNMQLRGPSRAALFGGPFAGEAEPVPVVAAPKPAEQPPATDADAEPEVPTPPKAEPKPPAGRSTTSSKPVPPPVEVEEPFPGREPEPERPPSPYEQDDEELPDAEIDPGDAGGDEAAEDAAEPVGVATVQLVPASAQYRVGETVEVAVLIDGATNVGSVPFHLRYNREVLQFLAPAEEGPFLRGDGSNTVFLAADVGGGGDVVVGLSRMGAGQGATGSGVLATFRFVAIGAGDCGFAFTGASVKNPQAGNLPAAFNAAAVQVAP